MAAADMALAATAIPNAAANLPRGHGCLLCFGGGVVSTGIERKARYCRRRRGPKGRGFGRVLRSKALWRPLCDAFAYRSEIVPTRNLYQRHSEPLSRVLKKGTRRSYAIFPASGNDLHRRGVFGPDGDGSAARSAHEGCALSPRSGAQDDGT